LASIFSQIRVGGLPGHLVFEDAQAFALMTIKPLQPGHLLVMPVQEIDHWDDLPADLLTHLMAVSRQLAKAIKIAFPCARVAMAICGLEIAHAHIHLFPVNRLEDFNFGGGSAASQDELADAAQRIKAALASMSA
jgi:diadenosine tetraphosphate (Ap4A) HIT family hydrolase